MAMEQNLLIPFLGDMNIHLPAILGFTRYQGFDPSPHIKKQKTKQDKNIDHTFQSFMSQLQFVF